jgi:hypothetical protein
MSYLGKLKLKFLKPNLIHYVKMDNKTGTERGISQTLTKQLSNPIKLHGIIILSKGWDIY